MIIVTCLPCELAIRVMPTNIGQSSTMRELEELVGQKSDFWPDKFPCPACGKHATGMREREADARVLALMTLRDVTPQEAFAAFNGLGFPDEQKCSLGEVEALLREQPVKKIIGSNVTGAQRTIIDSLELWDGTKVHFAAAAEGAVIYRITRPISYTRQALRAAQNP
jgi:hypothetical protein